MRIGRLTLRPGHDRRLRAGHPWVFSNEVGQIEEVVEEGDAVEVFTAGGEFLGTAYYNPRSLIAARLLSRRQESIDTAQFFDQRISAALHYREKFYPGEAALRIVHGEGDALPGLVVDRYGDILSVQFLTLGMERRREQVLAALEEIFRPRAVVARNDAGVRELEGLPRQVEVLRGELPDRTVITEHGLSFRVDILGGQKTGQFLDQKENHLTLKNRVDGGRVLDLFCYSGSWALHAAHFGAREVVGVDISAGAVALAEENVRLNGRQGSCSFIRADAFELLRTLSREEERFGAVILDPPAFVKSRKKLPEAIKGYLTINRRAMELVEPGGWMVSCSCSHHLDRETFLGLLRKAAQQSRCTVHLVEMRGQAFDHPVLLACPETEYLKCAVLHVS